MAEDLEYTARVASVACVLGGVFGRRVVTRSRDFSLAPRSLDLSLAPRFRDLARDLFLAPRSCDLSRDFSLTPRSLDLSGDFSLTPRSLDLSRDLSLAPRSLDLSLASTRSPELWLRRLGSLVLYTDLGLCAFRSLRSPELTSIPFPCSFAAHQLAPFWSWPTVTDALPPPCSPLSVGHVFHSS